MSTHSVNVVEIAEIQPHPNADRLAIVHVNGWNCVVAKDQFKAGDRAVYVEPDYVVPLARPEFAFLAKGREDKTEHRMKAVRLRGQLSFGLLIPVPDEFADAPAGTNIMDGLGIRRYEPPVKNMNPGVDDTLPAAEWPQLYSPKFDLEDLRKHEHVFQPGEMVHVTEKLHGGNGKCVWHNGRFYVGSRTRWLQPEIRSLWTRAIIGDQPMLAEWCERHPDTILYGEVYGPVQELRYGLSEPKFAPFAAVKGDMWLNMDDLFASLNNLNIVHVPVLYRGTYNRDTIAVLAERDSHVPDVPKGHMMEGVVIVAEPSRRDPDLGRVALKLISNRYWES